ncbi:hypothetical protein [Spirosoma panaciterrae]|uniref:hypothetical protein n=1 Tax=Spirosoma panaciterrae TaxID=496058 RepID=UPI0003601910|nr:hypothetical protein [Spirosoma panaciterrae]
MALVYATKAGNWSDTTVWNTGALPGSGDDVFASGWAVTINQNISARSLNTYASGSASAGGGFTNAGGYTVSVTNGYNGGTTTCLTLGALGCSVTGDSTGGPTGGAIGINVASSLVGTVTYVGNATANGTASYGLQNLGTATVNMTGNATGSNNTTGTGVNNASTGTINMTGNAYGGTGNGAHGVNNGAGGIVNVTGTATGGGFSNAYGVNNANTGTATINGIAIAGSAAPGAVNVSTGTMRVTRAVASTGSSISIAGVTGSVVGGLTVVKELEFGTGGQVPVSGFVKFDNSTAIKAQVRRENNTNVNLIDTASGGYPANSDVRYGVTNGSGTGTMRVPLPNQTQAGILVDNTVGTAANLTTADIVSAVQSALPRFVHAATEQSVGDQLAATFSAS